MEISIVTMESMAKARKVKKKLVIDIHERSSLLSPPIEALVLRRIPAYSQALKIIRPLTDQSWEILRWKLEAGRKAAEETLRAEEVDFEEKNIAKERTIVKLREFKNIWEPAKPKLEGYIDEFLAKSDECVKKGPEGSFAVAALQYARKKWFELEENIGKQLPLGMVVYLVNAKLISICNGKKNIFSCRFCGKGRLFAIRGLLSHVLSQRHEHEEELKTMIKPIDRLVVKVFPHDPEFNCVVELFKAGGGAQWLENLPICAPGCIIDLLPIQPLTGPSLDTLESGSNRPQTISQAVVQAAGLNPLSPDRVRAVMDRELARTGDLQIPTSIRLFMWFRLSINSYIREYNYMPDIAIFTAVASSLRRSERNEIFGTLSCGTCRLKHDDGRPLTWKALGEHFVNVHRKLRNNWLEKLIKKPTAWEIFSNMTYTTEDIWIQLLQEVDEKLARDVSSLVTRHNSA